MGGAGHAVSVLAVVPARSGSKGIPQKNVLSFRGKPLLVHSVEHALAARNVDRVLVSTDSPRYAEIARRAGAETPFLRPEAISGDRATDLQVFTHVLDWLETHEGYVPDLCVHLRPTYPSRTVADVEEAVARLLADPSADSVRSVALAAQTPYKMWRRRDDGTLAPLLTTAVAEAWNQPRQLLPEVFMQNAAVDVVRTRVIRAGSMTGSRILPHVMAGDHDIDDWRQWEAAERAAPGGVPTGRTFVFDLDGVLASLEPDNEYDRCQPCGEAIDLVNRLYAAGNRIVIHTARGSATGRDWVETTRAQLLRWGVRHHELRFGKPAADYYVDDRSMSLATLMEWADPLATGHRRESA